MFGQLLFNAIRVRGLLINFIKRHHNRDIGCAGMVNGFLGLRHDSVISGDDQDNHIGHMRTTGPHRGKSFMARGIQKCNMTAVGGFNRVGPDVLGNATMFTVSHLGRTDTIKQGCLTMVDVSHKGHDRSTWFQGSWVVLLLLVHINQRFFLGLAFDDIKAKRIR